MSDTGEWAERARKAQEAVNELGAGPPASRLRPRHREHDMSDAEAITARIFALDDFGRRSALMWLAGYVPEAVAAALDEMDRQAAAQVTEADRG